MVSGSGSATARGSALTRIAYYREQVAQFRQWAADETVPEARDCLLDVARQYERLAEALETRTADSNPQRTSPVG